MNERDDRDSHVQEIYSKIGKGYVRCIAGKVFLVL
jgi:hypothetical protein